MTEPLWIELLSNTKVRDILDTKRKVVTANYNEEIKDLLKKLSDNHCLSAVITDSEKPGIWGFVDILDLMFCILEVAKESSDLTTERIENLKWEGQCYTRQLSGNVVNFSRSNPFQSVSLDTNLLEVVKIFAKEVHRVAVIDSGTLVGVLSQSDIIQLLATRGQYIGSKLTKPISQVGLEPLGAASVQDTVTVVECLKFMAEHKLRAVPIVDWNSRMVANFSATDLLGINESNFHLLGLKVKEFLQTMYGFPKPPVVCTTSDTVESVLLRMVVHKVHRVYIVDDRMIPTGVISMTDIMQFLLTY